MSYGKSGGRKGIRSGPAKLPALPPAPKPTEGLGGFLLTIAAGLGLAAAHEGLLGDGAKNVAGQIFLPDARFRSGASASISEAAEATLPAGRAWAHELNVTRCKVEVHATLMIQHTVLAGLDPEYAEQQRDSPVRGPTVARWVADAAKEWAGCTTDISWHDFVRAWKAGSR